jgi:citrate/tricarballylate utilization protein
VLELELLRDGSRQLEICNACRYCEGLCAVFPALERRSFFAEGDITYLASLCHDCRACFDACPYAPPHEFAVDIPSLMSTVRERTHAHYAWPRWLAERADRRLGFALALSGASVALVLAATVLGGGVDRLFAVHRGPGSFYEVVPWIAMMLPFMAVSLFVVAVLLMAGIRYWRDTSGSIATGPLREFGSLARTVLDAATLRYLRGGGPGCTYPSQRPSHGRAILHSLVFYGFVAAFISTTLAAVYQDVFGILPPYPLLSAPVLFGSVGGAAMIVGCIGLLWLKERADSARTDGRMQTMDVAFIAVLLLVNLSGFVLLALRETAAMGLALDLHLGLTAGLFVTLPYGKFAHSVYRSLAILRHRGESVRDHT